MMNYVHRGDTLTVTAPYNVTSGQGALVGNIFGIAVNTASSGASLELQLVGVFDLAKDTSTFADGDKVYWDNVNYVATSAATSNREIGMADLVQANGTDASGGNSGDATVRVRLNASSLGVATFTGPTATQVAVIPLTAAQLTTLHSAPVALIADPGSGKVIVPGEVVFEFKFGTVAFQAGGAVSTVFHGATTPINNGSIPAATINAASGTSVTALGPPAGTNGAALTAHAGLDLYAAGADFTSGDGTANVWVYYQVLTLV
jgi:predicted RecA/RadA family phage recombinase